MATSRNHRVENRWAPNYRRQQLHNPVGTHRQRFLRRGRGGRLFLDLRGRGGGSSEWDAAATVGGAAEMQPRRGLESGRERGEDWSEGRGSLEQGWRRHRRRLCRSFFLGPWFQIERTELQRCSVVRGLCGGWGMRTRERWTLEVTMSPRWRGQSLAPSLRASTV